MSAKRKNVESIEGAETQAVTEQAKKGKKPLTADQLRAEEALLREEYPQIIEGTLQDVETNPESPHYRKRTVLIQCQHPGCGETRRVATSDLFQVRMCELHVRAARRAKMKAKRAAARAEAAEFGEE